MSNPKQSMKFLVTWVTKIVILYKSRSIYTAVRLSMVVMGWWLDMMILEVFSNLWFYDSNILWYFPGDCG